MRTGALSLQEFAADLFDVVNHTGKRPIYEDPAKFFSLSYATSAREVAWRGDGWLLGEYVRQVRAGIIGIIHKHKQLDLVQSEKDWRARFADNQGATIGAPR